MFCLKKSYSLTLCDVRNCFQVVTLRWSTRGEIVARRQPTVCGSVEGHESSKKAGNFEF